MRFSSVLFLSCLALSACANGDIANPGKLGDLKIIGMVSYKTTLNGVSDAAPGDTIKVRPYLSWVNGGGATVTWSMVACRDPGIAFGANATCTGAPDRVVVMTQTTPVVIGDSTNAWTDFMPEIPVTIPADFFTNAGFGVTNASTQYNGASYLIFLSVYGPLGDTDSTMSQVVVTTRTGADLAVNPSFDNIQQADGTALTTYPGAKVSLKAVYSGVTPTYPARDGSGNPVTSDNGSLINWYFSDGTLSANTTDQTVTTTDWTPSSKPSSRASVIVGILRDSRGGVSVKRIAFP